MGTPADGTEAIIPKMDTANVAGQKLTLAHMVTGATGSISAGSTEHHCGDPELAKEAGATGGA